MMMKTMGVIALAAVCGSAYAFDFSGGVGGGAIGDGAGSNTAGVARVITLTVSGTGQTVTGLTLAGGLGMTHTWLGDLTVVLSRGAVSVDLMDRNYRTTQTSFGLSSDLAGNYMFTNTVGDTMTASAAAGTHSRWNGSTGGGSTTAAGTFAGFNGVALDGVWTLTVTDWAGGDVGAIQGMRIVGTAVPEPASMAALGLGAAALLRRRRKNA